jgi:hypothetical protein
MIVRSVVARCVRAMGVPVETVSHHAGVIVNVCATEATTMGGGRPPVHHKGAAAPDGTVIARDVGGRFRALIDRAAAAQSVRAMGSTVGLGRRHVVGKAWGVAPG